MYNNISNQISDVQKKGNKFLYCDFNARVGRYIEGNKPTVRGCRKSWKKKDLVLINKEKEVCKELWTRKEVCKGLWARVQGQERSILCANKQ